MSGPGFRLHLCTPFGEEIVEGVTHLRLEAPDGALGVQPGHEPALLPLRAGALTVRAESESFVSRREPCAGAGSRARSRLNFGATRSLLSGP